MLGTAIMPPASPLDFGVRTFYLRTSTTQTVTFRRVDEDRIV